MRNNCFKTIFLLQTKQVLKNWKRKVFNLLNQSSEDKNRQQEIAISSMDLRIVTYFELCHFKIVSSHLKLRKSQFLDLDLCNILRGFGMVDFFCSPSTQFHHPWLAPSVLIILLNKLLNRGNRNIKFDFSWEERFKNKINVLEITCSIGKNFCKFVPIFFN